MIMMTTAAVALAGGVGFKAIVAVVAAFGGILCGVSAALALLKPGWPRPGWVGRAWRRARGLPAEEEDEDDDEKDDDEELHQLQQQQQQQ